MGKMIVIQPGGYHPFHTGHAALYQSALKAFPNADVYVAATNDTKTRPFPFEIKEKLAKLAGVKDGRFVQVKSPFQAKEILQNYNPEEDVVVFVRSEKDRDEQPKPGGTKKDGSPAYFQPYTGKNLQPFGKHGYIAYLPTVEFGPGIKSATEIRNIWPQLNDRRKLAMVMSLYPKTQDNLNLAQNVVKLLDIGMGESEPINEFYVRVIPENKVVDYVQMSVIPEMRKYNVPNSPENHYTRISSAIFEGVSKTIEDGKDFVEQFKKLDQRKNIPIKIGQSLSILNLRLSQDFAELFGFKNPKTITKIYREPTDKRIIQLEFDNDPSDVWPKQPLGAYNGNLFFDSIFLKDATDVDKAIMLLNLHKPETIKMRMNLSENNKNQKPMYSARMANIIEEIGDGYFLGDDSYDDDEGFTKEGYTLYYKEGNNQYRQVGKLNLSAYNIKPNEIENEINRLINLDQQTLTEKDDKSGVEQAYYDPETHSILSYARQHYPEEPDLQAAFVKFVLRSLKHSKNDDERQDNEIELLLKRVNSLQDQVRDIADTKTVSSQKVDESIDYLDEK